MTEGVVRIDQELCTGCGNCVATCPSDAITGERGQPHSISEERCVSCGRCVQICNGYDSLFQEYATAREERLHQRGLPQLPEALFAANDRCGVAGVKAVLAESSHVPIIQCGPAVCTALAEDFGLAPGSLSPGIVVAALRKLGFSKIYSFALPATVAVLEEAQELADRQSSGRILPVINSSCPASVKAIEQFYPELIHYLASVKSPHQIAGALFKSYLAAKLKLDPGRIYSVSVGSCNSRKFEASRPELRCDGLPHVDAVLTTRELAYLMKEKGLDLAALVEEPFDDEIPAIASTDRAYCVPGDITQLVLSTAHRLLNVAGDSPVPSLDEINGEGVRTTTVQMNGFTMKAAAVTGWKNAVPILDSLKSGKCEFSFLEILACPMGCVSGGGQPKVLLPNERDAVYRERARLACAEANAAEWDGVAKHPAVQQIYSAFFGKACGDKSNRLLHTQYTERGLGGSGN